MGHTISSEVDTHEDGTEDYYVFEPKRTKALNLIVSSVTNRVLRIALPDIGSPHHILKKLDELYDSKSAVTKISKITELLSMKYSSIKKYISLHIDKNSSLIDQLKSVGTDLPNELAASFPIAYIEASKLNAVTAAI